MFGLVPPPPVFDVSRADADGLVAVGGQLDPDTLLDAYRAGVFPWFDADLPVCWWSPDPRAVIDLDTFYVSSRLARTMRSGKFTVTLDRAFTEVMIGCSERRTDGTWITGEMLRAYRQLHELGVAHSLEVWRNDELVGGVYGVAVNGLFAAESMFHRVRDASKVALTALVGRLRRRGFALLDSQIINQHTASLGATEIPRVEYMRRLRYALTLDVTLA